MRTRIMNDFLLIQDKSLSRVPNWCGPTLPDRVLQKDCPIFEKVNPFFKEKDYSHMSSLVTGFALVLATQGFTVSSNYLWRLCSRL